MNHYEILGVKENATHDEIKSAYLSLVKKYHPDVYKGDKAFAEKKIKEINNSYDILSNPEERKKYDDELHPPEPTPTYDSSHSKSYYNEYSPNTSYNRGNNYYSGSYSQTSHTNYENVVKDQINKIHFKKRSSAILLGLFIYLAFVLFFLIEVYNFILLDKQEAEIKKDNQSNSPSNSYYTNPYQNNYNPFQYYDNYNNKNSKLDIYDFISKETLEKQYRNNYYKYYDTYEDFINSLNESLNKNSQDFF